MKIMPVSFVDIAIAGGGGLAQRLKKNGIEVAVFERD